MCEPQTKKNAHKDSQRTHQEIRILETWKGVCPMNDSYFLQCNSSYPFPPPPHPKSFPGTNTLLLSKEHYQRKWWSQTMQRSIPELTCTQDTIVGKISSQLLVFLCFPWVLTLPLLPGFSLLPFLPPQKELTPSSILEEPPTGE